MGRSDTIKALWADPTWRSKQLETRQRLAASKEKDYAYRGGLSPQAWYNREVRKDPLVRMIEAEKDKKRKAKGR